MLRTNKNSNITQFYTRLAKIKGNSKAAVAAASKLQKNWLSMEDVAERVWFWFDVS